MEEITLKVDGMHCHACEILITESLEELEGVDAVEVSHEEGIVKLSYDPEVVELTAIKQAIIKAGYTVE